MMGQYNRVAIAFHWAIAALIILNLWLGIAHDSLPRDWQVMPVHKAVGIAVLFLSVARLAWRLAHRAPDFVPGVTGWERVSAKLAHGALYALMILVPLTGWVMVSGGPVRRPLHFFWLFDIPYLPVSQAMGDFGHEAHEVLGFGMLGLAVVHVLAALWHHFGRRDATLTRMIPGLKQRR